MLQISQYLHITHWDIYITNAYKYEIKGDFTKVTISTSSW